MKLTDFIYSFKHSDPAAATGICRIRIFINKRSEIYVLISDLDENLSASVTNSIELIYMQLLADEKIPKEAIVIEHYPKQNTFDLVIFDASMHPNWKSISYARVLNWLECDEEEFDDYTNNPIIMREISDFLNGTPKIKRFEYVEPREISERRLEINSNKISKIELKKILDTYPSENQMSAFLKTDMSLLADCYAEPKEEYICFSEFPVGNGRADFAVFTGHSRMSVYLIEIKGAQNNLCRQNHYKEFRSEVQEGRGQLIQRNSWISTNYHEFRRFVHDVLKAVKNNQRPYNAFIGPKYKLKVDPEKDVDFHYVLIAGRTSDDLSDSHKRHIEDASMSCDIRTETWDSWCNKLDRD